MFNKKNLFKFVLLSSVLFLLCSGNVTAAGTPVTYPSWNPLSGVNVEDIKAVVQNTNEGEIGFRKFESEGPWDWIENMSANAINYLFLAGMILAPLLILFGAFMFFTSGGDSARVGKGKALITWSLIGLAVLVSARVIVAIVRYLFDF